jgi:fumarate reductase (CoM/CoB) subunit A
MMKNLEIRKTDVLVIGGGGAGCRAAIEAASSGCRVLLASKYPVTKSGATVVAESFYSVPLGDADPEDNPDRYLEDILKGGCGLSDPILARRLASETCDRARDLDAYGVGFKREESGRFFQMRGPGHRYPRALLPARGGLGIIRGLHRELKRRQVEVIEDLFVTKILTPSGRVAGGMGLDLRHGTPLVIESRAVVIATGGYSRLWSYNDVPCDCTGDGIIMAYDAGADLIDTEMALFYPTAVIHPPILYGLEMPHGLLLEQVGGRLLNGSQEEFLPEDLPTRDVMVALIYRELFEGRGSPHGGVFLDVSRPETQREDARHKLMTYLPEKYNYLLKCGIDISREPLEVAPMAHYTLGGVRIDSDCQTRVGGLYAAGEAAGNIHGANRLAGNALPETQVFGAKAGQRAAQWAKEQEEIRWDDSEVMHEVNMMESFFEGREEAINPSHLKAKLQDLMWSHAGVGREEGKLKKALSEIGRMKSEDRERVVIPSIREFNLQWVDALEVSAMLDLSEMVVRSALLRKETRGHHFRLDYPERNDRDWLKHILIRKEEGKMNLWTETAAKPAPANPGIK